MTTPMSTSKIPNALSIAGIDPSGGAGIFAETIRRIREALPECTVEVLTPDFEGMESSIGEVLRAGPAVFSHNLETVRRLQAVIRPQAPHDAQQAVDSLDDAAGGP